MAVEQTGEFEVLPGAKDDLPQGVSVFVDKSVRDSIGEWAILNQLVGDSVALKKGTDETSGSFEDVQSIKVPVRLVSRSMNIDAVRVSMHLRTLTGLKSSKREKNPTDGTWATVVPAKCSLVLVQPARDDSSELMLEDSTTGKPPGFLKRLGIRIWKAARRLDYFFEVKVWRPLFRAPVFTMRVTPSHPGEDQHDIVRIHPSCFDDLGMKSGGHVVLTWMETTTVATALEDPFPHGTAGSSFDHVRTVQAVSTSSGDIPDGVPANLVLRASQQLRKQLGIVDFPEDDLVVVVEVRRRLGTILRSHINRLAAPALGLAVAAAAVPEIRGVPVLLGGLGLLLIVVLSFWPLKMPKAPSGRWP